MALMEFKGTTNQNVKCKGTDDGSLNVNLSGGNIAASIEPTNLSLEATQLLVKGFLETAAELLADIKVNTELLVPLLADLIPDTVDTTWMLL
jgi:hypothetical protein